MGQVYKVTGADATPSFGHAVETFLAAHTLAGAWSTGTATRYRQTLTALASRLADSPVGADVAALAAACTAAFGGTGPAVAAHVAAFDPAARRKAGLGR